MLLWTHSEPTFGGDYDGTRRAAIAETDWDGGVSETGKERVKEKESRLEERGGSGRRLKRPSSSAGGLEGLLILLLLCFISLQLSSPSSSVAPSVIFGRACLPSSKRNLWMHCCSLAA